MDTETFLNTAAARFRATRRAIEAIPADQLDFRPTPDIMTARELAIHIIGNYGFLAAGMGENRWSLESFSVPGSLGSTEQLLTAFDAVYEGFRRQLDSFPDDGFQLVVKPFGVEQKISEMARDVAEHEIHHRGQLYVYLRLMGIKPPDLYS
jgi:uncharacterized damage-inducible protein DinB